jgi:hypothetical protein
VEDRVTDLRRFSIVKPTLQTKFHIDFDWWSQSDQDWHVSLQSLLCSEHQAAFSEMPGDDLVDWVDPETAEIQRVNGLQHILISHCACQPGFITEHTALVDAVFRLFLANGNMPLAAAEIAAQLGRAPDLILRTLSGPRIYRGLRPVLER